MLLGTTKLDTIELFKVLINSCILVLNKFVLVNNLLREYNEMKKKQKILKKLWNILYRYGSYKQKTYAKMV